MGLDKYSALIGRHTSDLGIVVVDGRNRVKCARKCLGALKAKGIIIWANNEEKEGRAGNKLVVQHGYRRMDFAGMGPINNRGGRTSLFYRDGRCLEL